MLFAAVNAGRYRGVDPETALNAACEKFIRRFRKVEQGAAAPLDTLSEGELAALWRKAKEDEA